METDSTRQEYALEPRVTVVGQYQSPEGVAAGLARISRDATPIPELVREAIDDSDLARRRNENIIYEYGHSSIAEGAVFGVAIENIPRSLSLDLVSHRLASYTQLSYRYVPLERVPLHFYLPPEYRSGLKRTAFERAIEQTYALYTRMYQHMCAHLLESGECRTEGMAKRRATEDARYVLPLAQTTQVGMTTSAREWGHVICRLLAHPQPEGQELAASLKAALQPTAPSLFPDKYLHALPYPTSALTAISALAGRLSTTEHSSTHLSERDGVTLLHYEADAERRLAATLLFRATTLDGAARAANAEALDDALVDEVLKTAFVGVGAHDAALREFETVSYTFELIHSEACYHQLIRHRMSTQLAQRRDPALGYTTPRLIEEAGCGRLYAEGMEILEDAYNRLGADDRAGIILGNGHKRRTLLHLNARELIELSRLRCDAHAQWDVRERTAAIVALVDTIHPSIAWACGGRDAFKAGALTVGRPAAPR